LEIPAVKVKGKWSYLTMLMSVCVPLELFACRKLSTLKKVTILFEKNNNRKFNSQNNFSPKQFKSHPDL